MNRLPPQYVELERIYARTIGRGMRSLAVTAAEPGEGVTTLASALAQRNRLAGRSTLLVDMNLRRPALGEGYGVRRTERGAADHAAFAHLQVAEVDDGLAVLPAPTSREENLILREPGELAERLKCWLERFDTVIFDTSPVNARNSGDIPADRVCAGCDGSLLVVLACRTPASAVAAAVDKLEAAEARLVGTVINDRFNPPLAEELARETRYLDRWLPRLAARMRASILGSRLLNLEH
jgi:Mrp family chromosome partitioning ATPase